MSTHHIKKTSDTLRLASSSDISRAARTAGLGPNTPFQPVRRGDRSMWIVALALRRPYTFVVMALLILILTPIVVLRTPTDIFPNINIPVISIVWNYQGLSPKDMSDRITSTTERALTTLVNDIDHIESQSLNGVAVVKIYFRPKANIQQRCRR